MAEISDVVSIEDGPSGVYHDGYGVEYERPGEDLPIRLRACHTRTQEVPMSTANPTTKKCIRGHEYTTWCKPCDRRRSLERVAAQRLLRPNDIERFYEKVTIGDKDVCWPWRGGLDVYGYGRLTVGGMGNCKGRIAGRTVKAHRFSYELNVGPIPEGLTLDHVKARGCTMKSCVNPFHLEPVTFGVNSLRGNCPPSIRARASSCPNGHAYGAQRSRAGRYRQCMECRAATVARYREKAAANG